MSIGLPAHLRKESVSRAFARAINTVAFICFSLAFVGVVTLYAGDPSRYLLPAAIALIPLFVTITLVNRYRTVFFTVAHLVIGGPAVYWFSLTVISQLQPVGVVGHYLLNLVGIALMLVGGASRTVGWSILWCTVGLGVSQGAVALASLQWQGYVHPHPAPVVVYVAVVAVLVILRLSQRGVRRVQSHLHRAARDDEFASLRYGIEATSAAVMHDTVLGHLAAIANAPFGAMNPKLQRDIKRDLEVLVGEEWLSEATLDSTDSVRHDWQNSALLAAITEVRALELVVEVTGDLTALSRLDARGDAALGPAVKQCLVNVIKHSGVMQAEVAIFGSDHEVSVLVVDAGKGFNEAETGADRLGLRQSVRRRIEIVSGTVHVWSTPELGTSVMIRVPVGEDAPALTASAIQ
ncbi:ATP-binding protein [Salinibacterium sp. NSLL150]|uniref:sensor histidine kinase n=1 Tax=unclassified Salinibacterium TaxID=2632331 RepID=UPI0018CE8AE3|nr:MULTISPECIES: ATP-binding protein [unclassified Salinibacterium]MBH0024902.1 ATP-binding protein [Salinibacterium sp. SWN248]MBH0099807.1 ATP-binding protein [Salinibacterium sp. NSLL35]MBH0102561.1 ATP-binding protein [Salinibacterium sp. NSLL150]MBH0105321.1 ATP-binding protein [Salinibacterium sp. NSLL16]MBH0108081.1 ATP-binding protein [Salinibacterium sp. NSLL17]